MCNSWKVMCVPPLVTVKVLPGGIRYVAISSISLQLEQIQSICFELEFYSPLNTFLWLDILFTFHTILRLIRYGRVFPPKYNCWKYLQWKKQMLCKTRREHHRTTRGRQGQNNHTIDPWWWLLGWLLLSVLCSLPSGPVMKYSNYINRWLF